MNKTELIDAIALKVAVSKSTIVEVVDAMGETIATECLNTEEGKVSVPSLGIFSQKKMASRNMKNNLTGGTFTSQPQTTIKFSPAKKNRIIG